MNESNTHGFFVDISLYDISQSDPPLRSGTPPWEGIPKALLPWRGGRRPGWVREFIISFRLAVPGEARRGMSF